MQTDSAYSATEVGVRLKTQTLNMEINVVDLADELYFDLEDIEKLEPPMVFSEVAPSIVFPEFNGTLFDSAEYPVQIGSRDTTYAGEIRGTYTDKWKPKSSLFGPVRNGGTKIHSAIDIYAPSGTPVVAICDGYARNKPMIGNEDIGNRVWLEFNLPNGKWRFIYGHLDKFEGESRNVKKGEVIGYSGCTGNSGKAGCGTKNKCGLLSDHVHLKLVAPSGVPKDPLLVLKWSLRYFSASVNDVDCSEVMKPVPA